MLLEKLIQLHSRLVNRLLPAMCVLCHYATRSASNICDRCCAELPILAQHCPQCARFLTVSDASLCGTCLNTAPPFEHTFALFPYEQPIIQLIVQLKFQHQLSHAKLLGELLAQKIQRDWYRKLSLPDVLVPIPLHPQRLRERGFNQAVEIARPIMKKLKIPADFDHFQRVKYTAAQSGLSAKARKKNIAKAFQSTRDYSGLSVAVLDDVITTGSTVTEFCKTLKKAGADTIHVWCVARRG